MTKLQPGEFSEKNLQVFMIILTEIRNNKIHISISRSVFHVGDSKTKLCRTLNAMTELLCGWVSPNYLQLNSYNEGVLSVCQQCG